MAPGRRRNPANKFQGPPGRPQGCPLASSLRSLGALGVTFGFFFLYLVGVFPSLVHGSFFCMFFLALGRSGDPCGP